MKNLIKKYWKWIVGIFLLILLLILLHNNKKLKQEKEQIIIAHNAEVSANVTGMQKMYEIITHAGDTIKYQKQLVLSQQDAISMGLIRERDLKNQHMKSIEYITELQEEITILKKPGTYVEPIIQKFDSTNWMRLPTSMNFIDKWYEIDVTATLTCPILDSLKITSIPKLTFGMLKEPGLKNVFKRPYPAVTYQNENPYIKVNGMNVYKFKEEKKWHQTTLTKVGFGTLLGFYLGMKGSK